MKAFYDFHLHSCLSPCGDADMTPNNIVNMAKLLGFDIIALTDHNSCKNCPAALKVGEEVGLAVVPGMELCTSEDAHIVCLFPELADALSFGAFVETRFLQVKNRPDIYGEQQILDETDNPIGTEETLLITAANISLMELPELMEAYHGVCFPAHIDKDSYSVTAMLGEIPEDCGFTSAEISPNGDVETQKQLYPNLNTLRVLRNSDAHYLHLMREPEHTIELETLTAQCVVDTLRTIYKN